MATVIYSLTWDPIAGSNGYLIEYRESNSGTWLTPTTSPNPTLFPTYDLVLDTGLTYYIRISSEGINCGRKYTILTLTTASGSCCPDGYTLSPDESYCYQINTDAPTIIQSGICLAISQLATQYSGSGTLLYDPGYSTALVGTSSLITTQPQWREQTSTVLGPMNRNGVWVDTDCNGTKDPLTAGQVLQITIPITTATAKTVYVGIGGDNTFRLDVNGTTIVDRDSSYGGDNFNYWHLFPVDIDSGDNYFNFRAVGDGTTNDSFAAVIYDNTDTELSSATSDGQLNILFRTQDLVGEVIDIATCASGYFLDTAGGSGAYQCIQVLTTAPIECTTTTTTTLP